LAARRLRVLALLVLRFGTAIDLLFHLARANPSHFVGFLGLGVRKLESVQCSPPWIKGRLTGARRFVAIDPAVGTEALTVASTQRREGQVQEDGVVRHGRKIDEVALDEVRLFVTGSAFVDEALVHRDTGHSKHGR